MNIGKRIQQIRQDKKITQQTLAIDLGITRQAVSKWESGKAIPDLENLMYISSLYDVSLDQLIKGDSAVSKKIYADADAKKWHKLNVLFFVTLLAYIIWIGFQNDIWHVGLAIAAVGMILVDMHLLLRKTVRIRKQSRRLS